METSRVFTTETTESELFQFLGLQEDQENRVSGTPRVVTLLASVLQKMIHKNERLFHGNPRNITIFHGSRVPSMSIQDYVERIYKYTCLSPSCFVAAFAYIQRYLKKMATKTGLTSLNVHRLIITSLMVAAKFLDDECYNNAYFAKVGGVSNEEINRLEIEFLFDLNFRLNVTKEMFKKYCVEIRREGNRGQQQMEQTMTCVLRKGSVVFGGSSTSPSSTCSSCQPI